jgi:hypothetical protein
MAAVNFVNPHDIMFFQTSAHKKATRIMDFPHPIREAPTPASRKSSAYPVRSAVREW